MEIVNNTNTTSWRDRKQFTTSLVLKSSTSIPSYQGKICCYWIINIGNTTMTLLQPVTGSERFTSSLNPNSWLNSLISNKSLMNENYWWKNDLSFQKRLDIDTVKAGLLVNKKILEITCCLYDFCLIFLQWVKFLDGLRLKLLLKLYMHAVFTYTSTDISSRRLLIVISGTILSHQIL